MVVSDELFTVVRKSSALPLLSLRFLHLFSGLCFLSSSVFNIIVTIMIEMDSIHINSLADGLLMW